MHVLVLVESVWEKNKLEPLALVHNIVSVVVLDSMALLVKSPLYAPKRRESRLIECIEMPCHYFSGY